MSTSDPKLIAVKTVALTKSFKQGKNVIQAVAGVDLTINHGEFVAIMGGSGSGKSTLMHLIAGLIQPSTGSVEVDGQLLEKMSDRQLTIFRRRQIGLVFQNYNLIPQLTAQENILLPVRADGKRFDSIADSAQPMWQRLGIEEQLRQYPDTLSGGQQQRIALARALVMDPSVILADEPTGSLDTVNTHNICCLFDEFHRVDGRTVILITHEPEVAFWAKRIIVLRDGKIRADIPRDQLPDPKSLAAWYQDVVAQGDAL